MKILDRRGLINASLAASLLLNVAILGYLTRSGGLRRIFLKLDLAELPTTRLDFQKRMEATYRKLPNTDAEVVFAGDSLVADGPWAEMYSEIHNRGIGGDTVMGVLGRLDEILESRPRRLILLLGANDLAAAVPDDQYLRHYRMLLERVRRESPSTEITVLGVMPVSRSFPISPPYDNARVVETNRRLKGLVAEFPGVRFLDLGPILADDSGELRREYSTDGMHISIEGYLALREALRGAVAGDRYRKPTEETPSP